MERIILSDEERLQVQSIELEALKELDRLCRKHNITYSLAGGTLIGAVRHNGFIPWDDDIDVSMLRSEYDRFREICKTELDSRFFYQSHETDPEYYHLFNKIRVNDTVFKETYLDTYRIHHGVYIDIFPVDNIPDNRIRRALQYYTFHFFRTGLMARYLKLSERSGAKKYLMGFFRVLFAPFSMDFLYRCAQKAAQRYRGVEETDVNTFPGIGKKAEIFPRSLFRNTVRHEFEDFSAAIPADYDLYLRQMYGDYMVPPPPEKRITRHNLTDLQL